MSKTKTGDVMAEISRTKRREEVDVDKMQELSRIGFNQDQICDYFGIGRGALETNQDWLDAWREGNLKFREAIIGGQFEIATDPNNRSRERMLIWLGKVHLGQKEVQQIESNSIGTFDNILKLLKDDEGND